MVICTGTVWTRQNARLGEAMLIVYRTLKVLGKIAMALLLALSILTIALWVRSRSKIEGIGWRTANNQFIGVFSDRGDLCIDRIVSHGDYPFVRIPRFNRVKVKSLWTYSFDRPELPIWNTFDVISASPFPYQRWGLEVTQVDHPYNSNPLARGTLVPATELHWNWEDDYYLRLNGAYIDSSVNRLGVRMLSGYRSVPVWTDIYEIGVVKTERSTTVAISYWLVIVVLLMLLTLIYASVRLSERLRQKRCRVVGRCVACGYDLRGNLERCSECGLAFKD